MSKLLYRSLTCHDTFDTRVSVEVHQMSDRRFRLREVHTYTNTMGVENRRVRIVTDLGNFKSKYEAKREFDTWVQNS